MTSHEEQRARPVNADDLLEVARAQGSIPMTDLSAASERHRPVVDESIEPFGDRASRDQPFCWECGSMTAWPCDAALFRDALDEAWRAYHAALAVAQGELDAERARADKAAAALAEMTTFAQNTARDNIAACARERELYDWFLSFDLHPAVRASVEAALAAHDEARGSTTRE